MIPIWRFEARVLTAVERLAELERAHGWTVKTHGQAFTVLRHYWRLVAAQERR